MKNVLGDNITLTLFGESHGEAIGAVLDGFTPGIKIDYDFLNKCMSLRRPKCKADTPRCEKDNLKIVSGVFNGYTTGAPITVIIPNENINSNAYSELESIARPSHADYSGYMK